MTKPPTKKRISFASLGLVAVVAAVATAFLLNPNREPAYAGKGLSKWLEAFDEFPVGIPADFASDLNNKPPAIQQSEEALRQIGTNALPFLIKLLNSHSSRFERKLRAAGEWAHLLKQSGLPSKDQRRVRAILGLNALGAEAIPAIPELLALIEKGATDGQYAATLVLSHLGPRAKSAVPQLIAIGKRGDRASSYAISAVWKIDPTAAERAGFARPSGLLVL